MLSVRYIRRLVGQAGCSEQLKNNCCVTSTSHTGETVGVDGDWQLTSGFELVKGERVFPAKGVLTQSCLLVVGFAS